MKYNKFIDHTLLKADATRRDIKKLCQEALQGDFASVCVNPCFVKLCKEQLFNSDVKVCTVIGFPLGANETELKGLETEIAVRKGADEIDMVINIGALKNHADLYVLNDIKTVVEKAQGRIVKVIIETCLLTEEEKIRACKLSVQAGAQFVKTSTGFSTGGATVEDVRLMKEVVKNNAEVKASGGVRTKEQMLAMIEAGATRIGTSNGLKLIEE